MEVKTTEGERKKESAQGKTRVLIRSAKAANLLSSLHNRLAHSTFILNQHDEEEKELRRENEELRMQLILEKVKNRKIKLCGFAEFLTNIVLCIGFWLLCLLIVFIFCESVWFG